MQKIIFSPSKYIQGSGEIRKLATYYKNLGQKGIYLLVDKFVFDHYKDDIVSGFEADSVPYHVEVFHGECSKQEIERNMALIKEKGFDTVASIGGGKTIDAGKACAYYLNIPIMVVPTIASTDAPCSALSVIYKENGEFDEYLLLKANPNVVIMDTDVIVHAPARLLVAGIGDAMATYFEAKACADSYSKTIAGGHVSKTALTLAELCMNILFEDGVKAVAACRNQVVTQAFENIVEANTYLSGIGFESGGLAAAHAIHNGLTLLPEGHSFYHGEKVSFGTITQLVLENRPIEEIKKVVDFCKSIGLPTCLKDLNMDKVPREKLYEVAKASTAEGETIHNMPFKVTADDVFAAILTADVLGQEL